MTQVNIYLNFAGNTLEAFEFYKNIFWRSFTHLQKFKDVPHLSELSTMTPQEQEGIMHIELPLGENMILMGTDIVCSMGQKLEMGNNFSISLQVESKQDAQNYFQKLSANGKITVPIQDMFWNAYYGACTDQYGIQWMINHQYKNPL